MSQLISLYLFFSFYVLSSTINEYGPFRVTPIAVDSCKGPRRRNCSTTINTIDGTNVNFDVTVKENSTPTKGRIVAYSSNKNVLTLQMKTPCNHVFFRPLIHKLVNVTKDCVILKGHYKFVIDIQDLTQKYYGGSFIYGNWTFKAVFYNEDCNLSCSLFRLAIYPKEKELNSLI